MRTKKEGEGKRIPKFCGRYMWMVTYDTQYLVRSLNFCAHSLLSFDIGCLENRGFYIYCSILPSKLWGSVTLRVWLPSANSMYCPLSRWNLPTWHCSKWSHISPEDLGETSPLIWTFLRCGIHFLFRRNKGKSNARDEGTLKWAAYAIC